MELDNIYLGIIILVLNAIPFLMKKYEYLSLTLIISTLLATIKILFIK